MPNSSLSNLNINGISRPFCFFQKVNADLKLTVLLLTFVEFHSVSHVFYEADLFLERQMIFISKIVFFNFFNIVYGPQNGV